MTFINISHLLKLISYKATLILQIFNKGEIADRVGQSAQLWALCPTPPWALCPRSITWANEGLVKKVIYNWYKAQRLYMKHGVYSKQYSSAKRADKIGYYLVFMTYIGCTSSKSMVSTWIVSYLLVYTWHTPLHYPHAANAGCVLAGVAPVLSSICTISM